MEEINNPNPKQDKLSTRQNLLNNVSPRRYQTFSAQAVLNNVGGMSEVIIEGRSRPFWVTDIVPTILDGDGRDVLKSGSFFDDLRVFVNIGGLDFTNDPIPILALSSTNENKDLQSGFILPPSHKFTFRFESHRLPGKTEGVMSYPLLIIITLKGYDLT